MSGIRRQSIVSSLVIYTGFAIGLVNTYFFTKEGFFEPAEYGLTTVFIAIAVFMNSLSNLGMPAYIYKFFPYYEDHLPPHQNDMLTRALLTGMAGFVLVMLAGIGLKHLVIQKFGTNSPLLIVYYYWIFPFGFGLTIYSILEAYTWSMRKPVVANYFREVQWRLFTTVLIVLFAMNIIRDFELFIKLFAFTYPGIAVGLLLYLILKGKIHFTLKTSKLTRRFGRKILLLCSFFYAATFLQALSKVFDSFVIAAVLPDGLDQAGIFALATVASSIIQAPQRGIISASMPHLSRAWKEKNHGLLQKLYQRSSINQLLFSCGIFLLIWLNFTDGVTFLGLKNQYRDAAPAFFLLGISVIVDMGTGLNAQIIATSVFWRFELVSGIVLVVLMLPLTYLLTKTYGLAGPAWATLISVIVYNTIRIAFLWKKFKLFPLTVQSAITVLLAAGSYMAAWFLFRDMHGFPKMLVQSLFFLIVYGTAVLYLKLSPDFQPVLAALSLRRRHRR